MLQCILCNLHRIVIGCRPPLCRQWNTGDAINAPYTLPVLHIVIGERTKASLERVAIFWHCNLQYTTVVQRQSPQKVQPSHSSAAIRMSSRRSDSVCRWGRSVVWGSLWMASKHRCRNEGMRSLACPLSNIESFGRFPSHLRGVRSVLLQMTGVKSLHMHN